MQISISTLYLKLTLQKKENMCQVKKEPSPCRDIETPERRCCEGSWAKVREGEESR